MAGLGGAPGTTEGQPSCCPAAWEHHMALCLCMGMQHAEHVVQVQALPRVVFVCGVYGDLLCWHVTPLAACAPTGCMCGQ